MIPDGERVVADYLREHPDVAALTSRVVGKTPPTIEAAWVRVTRLDAADVSGSESDHLIGFLLQLDCYAGEEGGQPEAKLIGRTVRAALKQMMGTVQSGAVVGGVRIVGDARIPDTSLEDARERVILTVQVWAHA